MVFGLAVSYGIGRWGELWSRTVKFIWVLCNVCWSWADPEVCAGSFSSLWWWHTGQWGLNPFQWGRKVRMSCRSTWKHCHQRGGCSGIPEEVPEHWWWVGWFAHLPCRGLGILLSGTLQEALSLKWHATFLHMIWHYSYYQQRRNVKVVWQHPVKWMLSLKHLLKIFRRI